MHHCNLILSLLLEQIEDILAAATKILSDNDYSNYSSAGRLVVVHVSPAAEIPDK